MKIKLIPITHPELESIEINTDVFLIGRLEEPFISFDSAITADMSRQHAKIFFTKNKAYIEDLDSLNGTTLNGQSIKDTDVELDDGDVLEFAKHLAYKIQFPENEMDATVIANQVQELKLILEPIDKQSGLDILVITGFPFLISKEAGVFASFKKNFATETNRISRRHAYVLQENNALKLIDMSSTNGTFINSVAIEGETPVNLKTGDRVSFAGDFFCYQVKLDVENDNEDATVLKADFQSEQVIQPDNDEDSSIAEPKTTFVNEPSPFLDILCDEVKYNPVENETPVGGKTKGTDKNSKQKKTSFIVSFIQQCRMALSDDEKPKNKSYKSYLIVLIIMAVAGGTTYYYFTDGTRDIKKLISAGNYSEASERSLALLQSKPESTALKDLYTIAQLNKIMPDWLLQLKQLNFTEAAQILQSIRTNKIAYADYDRALFLLQWVADMKLYMEQRHKKNGIEIFKDEKVIAALVSFWNNKPKQNRKILAMIARNVAAFKPRYEQVLSDIRLLENDQSLYIKAIENLTVEIEDHLQSGNVQALQEIVFQFEKKYQPVTGLDRLKLDIVHFLRLQDAVNNEDLEGVAQLQKQYTFNTPLFIKYSEQVFVEQLPSEQFSTQYPQAIEAWQTGKVETAITKLITLSDTKWGALAKKKLGRYRKIVAEFLTLQQAKEEADENFAERLFNFHALLVLPEDEYYFKMIEPDFQSHKQEALDKAQQSFETAKLFWKRYQDKAGIGGILRLEKNISNRFKKQAGNLSTAVQQISYCLKIYKNLHLEAPAAIKNLAVTIKSEIEKQRKWLVDLELILKPEIIKKKLDLLKYTEVQ